MKNSIVALISGALGLAIGIVADHIYMTKQCNQAIREVKEAYSSRYDKPEKTSEQPKEQPTVTVKTATPTEFVKNIIASNSYTISPEDLEDNGVIRVIAPVEVGLEPEYDMETLHYYTDGIVTDDDDRVLESPEDAIGDKALKSFGEYEPNFVYVVNEDSNIYYEIEKEDIPYSDREKKHDTELESIYESRLVSN